MHRYFLLAILLIATTAYTQREPDAHYRTVNSTAFAPGDRIVVGEVEVFASVSGNDSLVFHFVPSVQDFVAQHHEELELKLHVYFQKKLEKKLGEGRAMFIFNDIENYLNSYTFSEEEQAFRISSGEFHTVKQQSEHVLAELEITGIKTTLKSTGNPR